MLLAVFILAVVGIGLVIGGLSAPGEWYRSLQKPVFNPPNWVFAPVWTLLYVLIAVAGWRVFRAAPSSRLSDVWSVQMLLNWAWTPLFFVFHQVWAAFAVLVLLEILIIDFIQASWQGDRVSALLFLPYAAWVAFAGLLNLAIAVLN